MKRPSLRYGLSYRWVSSLLCIATLGFANGGVARAQESRRSGADQQVVVQLAYTLGEAHALRRLCAGPGDSTWYARMQRLEATEAVDEVAKAQLVESFNAGFAARQTQFIDCSRRSRATERVVAQRGATLARQLAANPQP